MQMLCLTLLLQIYQENDINKDVGFTARIRARREQRI